MEIEDEQEADFDLPGIEDWVNNPSLLTEQLQTKAHGFDKEVKNTEEIGADITTEDNAWLDKLLEEEKAQSDPANSRLSNNDDNTDLAKLLDDFGVESVTPPVISRDEVLVKMNSRLQSNHSNQSRRARHASIAMIFWVLGCGALLLLLMAQYVIFNLDSLMKNPTHSARLQAFCQIANCALPHADLDALKLTHITHRPSRVKEAAANTDITVAINNNSEIEQLFPNLKVSVYNQSALVGEFVASPEQYLNPPQRLLMNQQYKLIMFTIAMPDENIDRVEVAPFY